MFYSFLENCERFFEPIKEIERINHIDGIKYTNLKISMVNYLNKYYLVELYYNKNSKLLILDSINELSKYGVKWRGCVKLNSYVELEDFNYNFETNIHIPKKIGFSAERCPGIVLNFLNNVPFYNFLYTKKENIN